MFILSFWVVPELFVQAAVFLGNMQLSQLEVDEKVVFVSCWSFD